MRFVHSTVAIIVIAGIAGCASSEKSVSEPEVEVRYGPDAGGRVHGPARSPCMPGDVCQPVQQYIEPTQK